MRQFTDTTLKLDLKKFGGLNAWLHQVSKKIILVSLNVNVIMQPNIWKRSPMKLSEEDTQTSHRFQIKIQFRAELYFQLIWFIIQMF